MKSIWGLTLFAAASIIGASLALSSCAGVGGAKVDTSGGGGTSVPQSFVALFSTEQAGATYVGNAACSAPSCHPSGAGSNADTFSHTNHAVKGVTCESCHGPASAHAKAPSKTNILSITNKIGSTAVCAQCHGSLADDYSHSAHASFISDVVTPATTSAAQTKSSQCIICHSALYRPTVTDAGKAVTDFTDTQLEQIALDTVNVSPQSANCITCHDPHKVTGNLDPDGEEHQVIHSMNSQDTTSIGPGTAVTSYATVDQVCGQCHNGRGTNPADSALATSTSRPPMHHNDQMNELLGQGGVEDAANPPVKRQASHAGIDGQCVKCHMPNASHSFTVSYDAGCAPCHTASDAAARVQNLQTQTLNSLTTLKHRLSTWATSQYGAANSGSWDYTSNIPTGTTVPTQSTIPIQIKRARYNYWYLVIANDFGVHNAPYTQYLLSVANTNLDAIAVPAVARTNFSLAEGKALIQQDLKKVRQDLLSKNGE